MTTATQGRTRSRARFSAVVTGTLRAHTAVHVGSHDALDVDRPFAVDGSGRWIVPGTGLAGVLRERAAVPDDMAWWGDAQAAGASRIVVDDAVGPAGGAGDIRAHVSIDPRWGTAAPGLLYTVEVVPEGTVFDFRCEVDGAAVDSLARLQRVVAALTEPLAAGIEVGARRGSGLGRMVLEGIRVEYRDLRSRADLMDRVTRELADPRLPQPAAADGLATRPERFEIPVVATSPVMLSQAAPGDAVDVIPRTALRPDGLVHVVLPGSSVRGVLRAQARRILHTVVGVDDLDPAGAALLALLFGSPAGRGAVRVEDVHSRPGWRPDEWHALVTCDKDKAAGSGEPDPFPYATRNALLQRLRLADDDGPGDRRVLVVGDHVAIDRWTGGAHPHALYSVLEPWLTGDEDWQPVRVALAWRRGQLDETSPEQRLAARALLKLVLGDLAGGRLALGYGTTKGFGRMKGVGPGGTPPWQALSEERTAWKKWVQRAQQAAAGPVQS